MLSKIHKLAAQLEDFIPNWLIQRFLKQFEQDSEAHYDYRNIDGSENNANFSGAGADYLRVAPDEDITDFTSPSGDGRPSAREISNVLCAQTEAMPNEFGVSDWFWAWGQFIDHDIDLTTESVLHEAFPIEVPAGDLYFDPMGSGTMTIALTRSGFNPATGTDVMREQLNEITPFLDASMVYGSDHARNEALRADGGYLKTSAGNLLPYNEAGLPNAPGPMPNLFLAGDVRANENMALTSIHTLFVREHNRLVDELKNQNPFLDAEHLYQEAKVMVEAQIQKITYQDFLPLLIGEGAIAEYEGFDNDVNPQIMNIFATAAFRLGHSMLSDTIYRLDEDGSESVEGHTALRDAFFNPNALGNVDSLFRGLASNDAEAIDLAIVDEVRNFLFGPPGAGGFDLASLNIQRGRDHNLADYNSAREQFGLEKISDFSDITSDTDIQAKLAALYGSVDDIDVFIGGLAEDAVGDSMLGELFTTILVQQFTALRDGDAFWYEARLSEDDLARIQNTSLADIIERNSDVDTLQDNVFMSFDRIGGSNKKDNLHGDADSDLLLGFKGNDTLYGHDGDDELHGGDGRDVLYGGLGNDLLNGGKGHDQLHGGVGDDIFQFDLHSGRDQIMDFDNGDRIDLTARSLSYEQLQLSQTATGTQIQLGSGDSIQLIGVNADDIDAGDFLF